MQATNIKSSESLIKETVLILTDNILPAKIEATILTVAHFTFDCFVRDPNDF
jgi:hypothetical protein